MSVKSNEELELSKTLERARRNTLGDLLSRTTDRYPDKDAIAYNGERLTFRELDNLVNQTAQAFLADGVKKGDMITVLSKNSRDFVLANFALARVGAVMIPVNYMLSVSDIQYILEHAGATGFLASLEYAKVLDEASSTLDIKFKYLMDTLPSYKGELSDWTPLSVARDGKSTELVDIDIADDDLAHVLYTSGTESKPKGVMLTHKSIISEYVSTIIDANINKKDVVIHALPLYHSAQLHVFLGPSIYVGSSGIVLSSATPEIILKTIEEEKVTSLFCPPTVWISLLRHPDFDKRDLSTLRKGYYGAAIMPREVIKELSERLPNVELWNCYGQTEVAPLVTVLQPEDQLTKLGSAGMPVLNCQTRIVDENDVEVARGEIGEIVHRTPHAMKGYLHAPEKTAEAFRNGWFHSGDLGVMDEDGYITIIDRKKDMINTGGVNVSSREVEEAIYQMEGVSEVAVIGIPDAYWIEAITAIIVPKDGYTFTKEDVLEFCKANLSKFKVPKYVEVTKELPKNPSGKVLKRTLRDKYEGLAKE
ncbi:fatty acyl-CoA synthetase [Oceanobacillus halophilus]|uniref:Long-chain-fatty-acid--CoA ligase n=1 Tax=Oceanobacillus halophilus TaxID=930130 RepID=A0A495A3T5_9BACI|nr:fatty acyl-CoA synthetase [Oceanobacillus halophilus]RKQ33876.1 long-chain-fatty-acid--CoA ligase [Oceanobacillus halophilus]